MRYRVELNQNRARLEDCNANRHALSARVSRHESWSFGVHVRRRTAMPGGAGKGLVALLDRVQAARAKFSIEFPARVCFEQSVRFAGTALPVR
jgi:hypothetical protein